MDIEKITNDQTPDNLLDDNGLKIFWQEIKKYVDKQLQVETIDGGELSTSSEPGIIYDGGYL